MRATKGNRLRPRRGDAGFTLIELLVVIVILGILSAVTVFAVRGTGDKGKSSAVAIDDRTIRTAQEAYCAQNGRYGSGQDLVDGKFLSELPTYHQVNAQQTGGSCNGWRYSILRTAQAGAYGPGSWESMALPANFVARGYLVRLPDGRVLVNGSTPDASSPVVQIWNPSTGVWTPTDPPPPGYPVFDSNSAMVLRDDPATPKNECASPAVNNCSKILVWGKYLFDPAQAPGQSPPKQWATIPSGGPGCYICNAGLFETGNFAYVQLKGMPTVCGANCGKIVLFGSSGGCTPPACEVFDVYDPTDNSYASFPYPDPETRDFVNAFHATQLPDGRVFSCCNPFTGGSRFFDPASLSFSLGPMPPDRSTRDLDPTPLPVLPNGDLMFGNDPNSPRTTFTYTPQAGGPGSFSALESSCYGGSQFATRCRILGSLADGRVVAAKSSSSGSLSTSEVYIYNPAIRSWSRAADILNRADYRVDALLLDPTEGPCGAHCGKLLTAGTSAEFFVP